MSDADFSMHKGPITIKEIKEMPKATIYRTAELFVKVVELSTQPLDAKKRLMIAACDATDYIQMAVPEADIGTFKSSIPRNRTIRIQNFFACGGKLYLNSLTSMMKVPGHDIVVSDTILENAKQAFTPPTNIKMASSSPEKTQIKVLRGRITKIKPLQLVSARATGKQVKLIKFRMQDSTGSIPISVWGNNCDTVETLEVGTCVSIQNGFKGTFNRKPTINMNESKTTAITIIPEPLEWKNLAADLSSDEDDEDTYQGKIEGIGRTIVYDSCPYPPCAAKKLLDDDSCPKCNQQIEENRKRKSVTTTFSIRQNNELITYRVFHMTVVAMFTHINEQLPNEPSEIEDIILDHLPLDCKFTVGAGTNANIITRMTFA